MLTYDKLYAAIENLLESGDSTGCDRDLIVVSMAEYQTLRKMLADITGIEHGESPSDEEADLDYGYKWDGVGLTITTPSGTCFMQGEEASELHDLLEAAEVPETILAEYEDICE